MSFKFTYQMKLQVSDFTALALGLEASIMASHSRSGDRLKTLMTLKSSAIYVRIPHTAPSLTTVRCAP